MALEQEDKDLINVKIAIARAALDQIALDVNDDDALVPSVSIGGILKLYQATGLLMYLLSEKVGEGP